MKYHSETKAMERAESVKHERMETPEQEYMEHKKMEKAESKSRMPKAVEVIAKRKFK